MKLWLLILLAVPCLAQAQQAPLLSLHAVAQPQMRAGEMTVELLVLNTSAQSLSYAAPVELPATLQTEQRSWIVNLHAAQAGNAVTLAAGQFISIPYVLTLPGDATGRVLLEVTPVTAQRIVIEVRDAETLDQPASAMATLKQQEAEAPPAAARIERTFANRFGFHEPMYFLYGPDAPAVKFQFSFKYRFVGEGSKFGALVPPFRGFYFGYTQRSLWDIDADSSPFYDTSYMPELFFEWLAPEQKNNDSWVHWLGAQTGVRHESNGKDGLDSRSLNIAYLRGGVSFGSLTGWQLMVNPRVFTYLGKSKDNPDIQRYRGYGELDLAIGKNESFRLGVTGRLGTDSNKGSIQVDVTQPVRIPFINLETYLQAQYFDGYGESLRTYNQRSSVWRVGFALVL